MEQNKFIQIDHIEKIFYGALGDRTVVFEKGDIEIKFGENTALLGFNGAGKSTLLKMISGAEPLSRGTKNINGTVSWPIGIFNSLVNDLTGLQNIDFISTLYDLDAELIRRIVVGNSELEDAINKRVSTYSNGMRAKLAYFISLSIDFDFFLFDEVTSVGDSVFRQKAEEYFKQLKDQVTIILATHNQAEVLNNCDYAYVLHDKMISPKYSAEDGVKFYQELIDKNTNDKK